MPSQQTLSLLAAFLMMMYSKNTCISIYLVFETPSAPPGFPRLYEGQWKTCCLHVSALHGKTTCRTFVARLRLSFFSSSDQMGLLEFTFPVVRHHQLLLIFITGTSMNIEQAIVFLSLGFQQTRRICVNLSCLFSWTTTRPTLFLPSRQLGASCLLRGRSRSSTISDTPYEMIKDYTGPCSSDTCL
jgi:hypothetical protein